MDSQGYEMVSQKGSMMEEIRKLPLELNKYGNHYRLWKRGEHTLIYAESADPRWPAFEVFEIRIAKAKEIFGRQYPPRELFPGNEDCGKWSVWCNTEEKALAVFDRLEVEAKHTYTDNQVRVTM